MRFMFEGESLIYLGDNYCIGAYCVQTEKTKSILAIRNINILSPWPEFNRLNIKKLTN